MILKKTFILFIATLVPSLLPVLKEIKNSIHSPHHLNSNEIQELRNQSFSFWADELDETTVLDGWATYKVYYENQCSFQISYDQFLVRIKQGVTQDLNSKDFLELNIENHRLHRAFDAKLPEEAYPIEDRPRGIEDVESVKHFMNPSSPLSPILVAIIQDTDGNVRKVKLDGVHRLIAAHICKHPIRVVWVDLTPKKDLKTNS